MNTRNNRYRNSSEKIRRGWYLKYALDDFVAVLTFVSAKRSVGLAPSAVGFCHGSLSSHGHHFRPKNLRHVPKPTLRLFRSHQFPIFVNNPSTPCARSPGLTMIHAFGSAPDGNSRTSATARWLPFYRGPSAPPWPFQTLGEISPRRSCHTRPLFPAHTIRLSPLHRFGRIGTEHAWQILLLRALYVSMNPPVQLHFRPIQRSQSCFRSPDKNR